MNKKIPIENNSQFLVYQTDDGKLKIDVRFEGETVWLTQQQMAELFQTSKQNISLHIQNIYEERELEREPTVKDSLTVQQEGNRAVRRRVELYNLDVIISVGYRVKSAVATRFRIWATQRLREYIVKGFVLDDERLKNPDQPFDYFEELTRRIQDIRTSERRFYQKITDIYATSIDYDPTQEISISFFKTVQNKVHWAITGQTAAEIVHNRVDAAKPNLGLINWRGAVIRKQDIAIAKNYLAEPELAALNNLVEQYLVFAEGQAMRRLPVFFVLDCSESMAGENLRKMEERIGMIVRNLRQDPHALKTAYLSVIAFAGIARTIAPLVEVFFILPPKASHG